MLDSLTMVAYAMVIPALPTLEAVAVLDQNPLAVALLVVPAVLVLSFFAFLRPIPHPRW
jgi:hypothetical protein